MIQEVQARCRRDQFTPGDVYPSAKALMLLEAHGDVVPDLLYWGFQTQRSLVINAQSETADKKVYF